MIVKLDMKKLLGFRLGGDAKTGGKIGGKIGGKVVNKPAAPASISGALAKTARI